jgi:hypothetical protein
MTLRDDTENENVTKLNFVNEIRLCHSLPFFHKSRKLIADSR